MWVDKDEWNAMNKRITDLEAWKSSHGEIVSAVESRITVYSDQQEYVFDVHSYLGGMRYKQRDISIKELVLRILRHLGMELVYIEGKPTTIEMQKSKRHDR
mgnify:CR=1 FL=1